MIWNVSPITSISIHFPCWRLGSTFLHLRSNLQGILEIGGGMFNPNRIRLKTSQNSWCAGFHNLLVPSFPLRPSMLYSIKSSDCSPCPQSFIFFFLFDLKKFITSCLKDRLGSRTIQWKTAAADSFSSSERWHQVHLWSSLCLYHLKKLPSQMVKLLSTWHTPTSWRGIFVHHWSFPLHCSLLNEKHLMGFSLLYILKVAKEHLAEGVLLVLQQQSIQVCLHHCSQRKGVKLAPWDFQSLCVLQPPSTIFFAFITF